MSKRPVEQPGVSPRAKRRKNSLPETPIHKLLQSLVSEDARMRSVSLAGLTSMQTNEAEQIELVRAALERQLWIEQDPFLVQQLVKALVHQCGKQETTSVLQKYYISEACKSDSSKLCVISALSRFPERLELLKPVESKLLQDGERENPMLRLWVIKFLVKCHQRQQEHDYLVSEVLVKKFFDVHDVVRGFALEAAISLNKLGYTSLEIFRSAGLHLLKDGSEFIRLSAMKLLRRCVTEIQALNEEQSTEKKIDHCYLLMCSMITDSSMKARREVCQLLGSMTSASSKVKLHSLNKKSTQLVKDDPAILNAGDAPVAMAAGAFVSAVEDEFPEVRSAAIQSLTSLSLHCPELISSGVLALFLDLLNDQHVGVRMETLGALSRLAERGLLYLQQKQVLVVCDVLKDCREVRILGRKLLSCMRFPTVSEFNFVVQSLLNSIEQHPEEKEDIFKSLLSLGDGHAAHVEALTSDFGKQMKLLRKGDKGLDDPKVIALVNLCRGSIQSEGFIFPGVTLDVASKLTSDCTPELMLVIQRALMADPRSKDALKVLSACGKALAVLETSPQVNLGILYLESLTLVAKLRVFTTDDDDHHQRLLVVNLRAIQTRFSGFTSTGSLQLLELKLLAALIQSSSAGDAPVAAIVNDSRGYSSGENFKFPLLKVAAEQLQSSSSSVAERRKLLAEAARSFWPENNICCSEIQEMRGYLRVPASDFEHRLKFIPGFPYQVKVCGELKHMRAGCRVWMEMGFEYLPCQYSFLRNTGDFKGSMEIAEEVTYYNMPVVSSGSFRVRIVAELLEQESGAPEHRRGPQASSLVPVSDQQVLYLQANNV